VGSNPTARATIKLGSVSKIRTYFSETYDEMLHNVTWPTWKELQNNTIIVVVASILISVLIFLMDYLFGITGSADSTWRGLLGFIYKF
jgi:preprotein translocase subunit SecE